MRYKIGDKVRTIRGNHQCTIESIHKNRYYIEYTDLLNVQGTNVESWVAYSDIKLDVQYLRQQKLKQLGI
jgi:hypothetical protein